MDDQSQEVDKALKRRLNAIGRGANSLGEQMVESFQDHLGKLNPGWAPLSPATQSRRIKQGYAPNEPLLRSGTLRDSFSHAVAVSEDSVEIVAGIKGGTVRSFPYDTRSRDMAQLMIRQERGSGPIPPRPLLPLVADEVTKQLHKLFQGEGEYEVTTGVTKRAF